MKKRRSRKYIAVILAAVMTLSMVGYPGMVNAKEIDVLEESSPEKALTSEMEDQPEIQPEPVTLAEPEVQPEPTVTPEPENEPEPTTPLEPETPPEPTTPPESVTPSEPEPTAQPEESSAPAPTPPSEPQESTPEPAEPSETEIPGKDQPEAEKPQEAVTPTPVPEKKNTGKKKNVQKKASTQAGKDIPAGTRVDENREEINNNYGYIEFNFGTIKNNQGTVEHNFGKINENNGVIEENYITFEHGIQPSGTVGSIRKQYYEVNVDMSSITAVNFRIKFHHYLLVRLKLFHVVNSLVSREEWDACHIHAFLYLCLTGETGFQLVLAFDPVDGCAGTAESVSAAASSF